MRNILWMLLLVVTSCTQAQPAHSSIEADIKREMGPNCAGVTVTGTGKTVKEYDNGAWVNYFRIPVNAVLKTDMQGVTRLMKGAAVYTVSGGSYHFVKYNTGSGEYVGLAAPDEAVVKQLINSLPDMALGGRANVITAVDKIIIEPGTATWHTLLSVSMKCEFTYWRKKTYTELEQLREPFDIRLYRKDANSAWNQATLLVPNAASDNRRKEILGTKKYNNEKTIIETAVSRQAQENFRQLPAVDFPVFTNIKDLAVWLNNLLIEGNEGKVTNAYLTLIHPAQKNSAGIVSGNAADLLEKLKKAVNNDASTYRDQYCSNINIKDKTPLSIEWWNKDKTKFSRMMIQQYNNRWYLTDLSINIWESFNAANAQRTASVNCN